jgi:bifunctional DNA-binding transcriptional regulator/antitoxin component of YhaV-PrlF toxin-antitoxin module
MKITSQVVDRGHQGRITIPVRHLRAIGAKPQTPVRIFQRGNSKFLSIEKGDTFPDRVDKEKVSFGTVDLYGNIKVSQTPLNSIGESSQYHVDVNTSKGRIEVRKA